MTSEVTVYVHCYSYAEYLIRRYQTKTHIEGFLLICSQDPITSLGDDVVTISPQCLYHRYMSVYVALIYSLRFILINAYMND